jgi:hypothetical protein
MVKLKLTNPDPYIVYKLKMIKTFNKELKNEELRKFIRYVSSNVYKVVQKFVTRFGRKFRLVSQAKIRINFKKSLRDHAIF